MDCRTGRGCRVCRWRWASQSAFLPIHPSMAARQASENAAPGDACQRSSTPTENQGRPTHVSSSPTSSGPSQSIYDVHLLRPGRLIRWRTASRSSSWGCSPTAPPRTTGGPTSSGCCSPHWPMPLMEGIRRLALKGTKLARVGPESTTQAAFASQLAGLFRNVCAAQVHPRPVLGQYPAGVE